MPNGGHQSHACGWPLEGGRRCRHMVTDPAQLYCGRHHGGGNVSEKMTDDQECSVREVEYHVWRCATHSGPQWQVAHALGAELPCRIPLPSDVLVGIACAPGIHPETAQLLAAEHKLAIDVGLAGNNSTPLAILRRLAEHESAIVRSQVAGNFASPPEALERAVQELTQMALRKLQYNYGDQATAIWRRLAAGHKLPPGLAAAGRFAPQK